MDLSSLIATSEVNIKIGTIMNNNIIQYMNNEN